MESYDLNLKEMVSRQSMMIPVEMVSKLTVTILGVGGIGSNVALLLGSMGISRFTLVDTDRVSEENIYPGHFSMWDIGEYKTDSVKGQLVEMLGVPDHRITSIVGPLEIQDLRPSDIIIVCTDSLSSRRRAYERHGKKAELWIDCRMGGTLCSVYAVPLFDSGRCLAYEETLIGEDGNLPCGMKSTSPITKGFVSGMVGQVVYDYTNSKIPPYWQWYDLVTRTFFSVNNHSVSTN